MPFTEGTRLGPYEVLGPLGIGGMGEVVKARDTRLDRLVAVKVLAASLSADPEFRQRFDREARSISALDHPNICALYDVGEHDGTSYLVMQYLEGQTLAERLTRGPLSLDEALRIGTEVASALDAAHRAGIVHRDLKPGNIMLTKTGARLLDFGLAKAGGGGTLSATALTTLATSPPPASPAPALTAQGTILGTFQYMAPEQIEGEEADARTDIFAFGAVLYEMVTGRRAFSGKTQASLIGAILKDVPAPAGTLAPDAPPALERIITRCLAKDPDARWQTARDLMLELQWIASDGRDRSATTTAVPATSATAGRRASPLRTALLPVVTALLAALGTWLATRPGDVIVPRVEFAVPIPSDTPVRRGPGEGVAISPDGRLIVYVADPVGARASMLYLRRLDEVGARPLTGTEGAFAPFFSPDSRQIGFFTDEHVMRVPAAGGTPSPITEKGSYSRATWTAQDTIVLGTSLPFAPGALAQVPATGGVPTPLTTLAEGEELHQLPRALPDGRHVLFSVHNQAGAEVAVASLDSGGHRKLGLSGSDVRYVAPGHVIFARGSALFTAPFDLERMEVTGPEVSILPEAEVGNFGLGVVLGLADVDSAGNLVYVPGLAQRNRRLAWMDQRGRDTPIDLEPALYIRPRISPDGRRFVVSIQRDNRIRVVDVQRELPLDLDITGQLPIWGPGDTLTFQNQGVLGPGSRALAAVPADNSAPPEALLELPDTQFTPEDWTPDGRGLLFMSTGSRDNRGSSDRDLNLLVPGGAPRALLDSTADESGGRISPDGRWLAYESTSSGRTRVYVRPFDRPGGTLTVSGEGGFNPVWARDGRALFFVENGVMMRAAVELSPFSVGIATELFALPESATAFDVGPDGRFLVVLDTAAGGSDELRIVLGWSSNPIER